MSGKLTCREGQKDRQHYASNLYSRDCSRNSNNQAAIAPPVRFEAGHVFGHGLGWVNTRIILGVLFYVLILPVRLLMRLFGSDPMARKRDEAIASYRVKSVSEPKDRLERPY